MLIRTTSASLLPTTRMQSPRLRVTITTDQAWVYDAEQILLSTSVSVGVRHALKLHDNHCRIVLKVSARVMPGRFNNALSQRIEVAAAALH